MDVSSITKYLNDWGQTVVDRAKKNLGKKGGGELEKSIKFKVNKDFSVQFMMVDYGEFQDKGVKGEGGEIKSGDHEGTWGGRRYYTTWEGKRKDSEYQFGSGKSSGSIYKGIAAFVKKKGLPKEMVYPIVKVLWIKGFHGISFFQEAVQFGMMKFSNGFGVNLKHDIEKTLSITTVK
jgi:hypothetical protein